MLTKLTVKQAGAMQHEYAQRSRIILCREACRINCTGESYTAVFTMMHDESILEGSCT